MAEQTIPIHTERLYEALIAACPIESLSVDTDAQTATFVPAAGANAAQIAAGNVVITTFDWSVSAYNTWRLAKVKQQAEAALDNATDRLEQISRAIALTVLHDVDTPLREWITQFKAATAAATNLTDLKTRVAALPNMPNRTVPQLIAAVKSRLQT